MIHETPARLAALLEGVSADEAREKTSEYFSIVENVCHLRDIEADGYAVRIRRILEEEKPQLPDLDGEKLAIERRYNEQDLRGTLDAFVEARNESLRLLASATDLDRGGELEGVGFVTLRGLTELMQKHDEGHLRDLAAIRAVGEFNAHRDEYLKDLIALCRIPGVSNSDPANVRRSAEATAELLRKYAMENVQILEIENAHPGVYAERRGPEGAKTVLFYAHHDIQPVGDRSRWTRDPFDPIEENGRLYARGASDDKAGVVALIAAAASWRDLPCNVKFFIEGEEEIGSPNLGKFLTKYRELLQADVVVLADSPNFDTGIPALTYRLRGMCQIEIEVKTLERPLHSGRGAGVVPDAVMTLCKLLSELRVDESNVAELSDEERNALSSLKFDEERIRRDAAVLDGVELVANDRIPERLWTRPAITIIAFEARPLAGSFNQILDSARARISIRTVPNLDSREVGEAIVKKLTSTPGVTARVASAAPWWRTDAKGPVYDAARRALKKGYGIEPVMQGTGGTISFVRNFADAFDVPLILLGVEDPPCNAHSENESLHLGDWEKCARSVIHLLGELGA